jgi:hypothetical protein
MKYPELDRDTEKALFDKYVKKPKPPAMEASYGPPIKEPKTSMLPSYQQYNTQKQSKQKALTLPDIPQPSISTHSLPQLPYKPPSRNAYLRLQPAPSLLTPLQVQSTNQYTTVLHPAINPRSTSQLTWDQRNAYSDAGS